MMGRLEGWIHNGRIGIGFRCATCGLYEILPDQDYDLDTLATEITLLHTCEEKNDG